MDFEKQRRNQNSSISHVAVATILACLLAASVGGCSTSRALTSGGWRGLRNSGGTCESCRSGKSLLPTCQAPGAVVVGATVEPLQPSPPSESSAAPGDISEPSAASETSPINVPEVPVVPPGPDAIGPAALVEVPIAHNPEPAASLEDLNRCQSQMAELNSRFSTLEETHLKSQQALVQLLAEQRRLKLDNERLKQELELNHRQDIESLDSLSKIIEEVVAAPSQPSSASPDPRQNVPNGSEAIPVTPLPAVEKALK